MTSLSLSLGSAVRLPALSSTTPAPPTPNAASFRAVAISRSEPYKKLRRESARPRPDDDFDAHGGDDAYGYDDDFDNAHGFLPELAIDQRHHQKPTHAPKRTKNNNLPRVARRANGGSLAFEESALRRQLEQHCGIVSTGT